VIGFCGFRDIDGSTDIEILYALLPTFWGQGLAAEAARAALDYGFRENLFTRVLGRTDVPNEASRQLLQRLGMRFESHTLIGDLPTVTYSLTKPFLAEAQRTQRKL
jgi:ribosomal-protein-alanine N-acetyltransferase